MTFTPTLPALSEYIVKHPSFWDGNKLMGISHVNKVTFSEDPTYQILSYDIVDGFKSLGSEENSDRMITTFSLADNIVSGAKFVDANEGETLVSYTDEAGIASKQYGKEFTVNVSATYLNAYTYSDATLKEQSFKMVVLSPVYEGTIATETKLEVGATAGAKLSMADIVALNYNKQSYSLYKSKYLNNNKVEDLNATNSTANIFDYAAVKSVVVESTDDKVFTVVNEAPTSAVWDEEAKKVIPGTVEISTKEITNNTETKIKVTVTDVWGYKKVVEIPLTIKMVD